MYNPQLPTKSTIRSTHKVQVGEAIEQKIQRMVRTKEPIKDNAPLIYTNRKDGVIPIYDPRTDKWEMAVEEMDARVKNHLAKREDRHKDPAAQPKDEAEGRNQAAKNPETGADTGATDQKV